MSAPEFESVASELRFDGKLVRAGIERFRYGDGNEVSREKVWHPGAVGILALDDTHVWLTRQPREVAGVADSLEIPAGKIDVEGEGPLETGRRELAEEIGKQAASWQEILAFYTSPGFTDERIWLFLATDLADVDEPAAADEDEQIEIVPWPLDRLEEAISGCEDAKSLIALFWLALRQSCR